MAMRPSLHALRVANWFFTAGNFRGKWRIERFVLPRVHLEPAFYLHPFGFWWKIEDESSKRTFLANCENSTTNLIEKVADSNQMMFVDVGANRGWYSLLATSLCSASVVIAFEPEASARSKLNENLEKNGYRNVRVFSCAVGANPHTAQIWSYFGNDGMHTLYPIEDWNAASGSQVEVRTLDECLGSVRNSKLPILIKIDVEGSEMDVLRGGSEVLRRDDVQLVVEINETLLRAGQTSSAKIFEYLKSFGFSGYWISPHNTLVAQGKSSPLPHQGKIPELEGANYFFTRDPMGLAKKVNTR